MGVDLLRQQSRADNVSFVRKKTSAIFATLLSMICPGLGAAYNGQIVKALVYFAIFIGLFQMAVLTGGTPLFVLGFIGMWLFAALDSFRTAQMIRAGLTPDVADDILVQRFSGSPKLWGIVLTVLGSAFLLQRVLDLGFLMRGVLPVMLIVLGIYVLRGVIFKPKSGVKSWTDAPPANFALGHARYNESERSTPGGFSNRTRSGTWRDG